MATRFVTLGALVFLLITGSGCSRLQRARQCRNFAALVNPDLDEIERVLRTGKRDAATLEAIARRYQALADRILKTHPTDAELTPALTEFHHGMTEAAELTRSLAEAVRVKDATRMRREQAQLTQVSRKHRMVVEQLAVQCHS